MSVEPIHTREELNCLGKEGEGGGGGRGRGRGRRGEGKGTSVLKGPPPPQWLTHSFKLRGEEQHGEEEVRVVAGVEVALSYAGRQTTT